jgi:peroxiredoxin (alkyl hydroperoxide reductase subunit C)
VAILDISIDSFASQKAFAEANGGISFKLLADFHPKGAVAQAYGIYNEERGIAGRSSFVIDSAGQIVDARVYPPGELPDPQELLGIAKGS